MAPIYEEIVLAWEGKEFTVQPSFRMVQRIEKGGISIAGVIAKMTRGEPPMSQVAEIVAHMLQSGGANGATPERVYAHLSRVELKEYERISIAIILGFIPQEPDPGNSEGPADGAPNPANTTTENPTPT